MRRLITSLVVFVTLPTTGLAAQDPEPAPASFEYSFRDAGQEGMAIQPAPDSATRGALPDSIPEQLEQQKQSSGVRKAIVIGAAVGAAVFVGFLVFVATAMN
jgi:hypothetical protein